MKRVSWVFTVMLVLGLCTACGHAKRGTQAVYQYSTVSNTQQTWRFYMRDCLNVDQYAANPAECSQAIESLSFAIRNSGACQLEFQLPSRTDLSNEMCPISARSVENFSNVVRCGHVDCNDELGDTPLGASHTLFCEFARPDYLPIIAGSPAPWFYDEALQLHFLPAASPELGQTQVVLSPDEALSACHPIFFRGRPAPSADCPIC
ncbi:hypothetical protein C7435_2758 [Maricaulis maris]|uniref:Lipoprotein n=1 Tax=Maricaulis maris TaxID=74318 RepID=A0A495D2B9_9PROT|nr:hypothetical protein C7435_2758 [Maricaulis maris]